MRWNLRNLHGIRSQLGRHWKERMVVCLDRVEIDSLNRRPRRKYQASVLDESKDNHHHCNWWGKPCGYDDRTNPASCCSSTWERRLACESHSYRSIDLFEIHLFGVRRACRNLSNYRRKRLKEAPGDFETKVSNSPNKRNGLVSDRRFVETSSQRIAGYHAKTFWKGLPVGTDVLRTSIPTRSCNIIHC